MEPFGALGTEVVDANSLQNMAGPWGLEPRPLRCQKQNVRLFDARVQLLTCRRML